MDFMRAIEFGLSPLALLLLVFYHVHLYRKVRLTPLATAIGAADEVRARWVEDVIARKRDILAVQTLRNWTMASTFLASAAILIALGVFNLALTADRQGELAGLLHRVEAVAPALWLEKLMLLAIDFFFAFFNFTLAIRYYNHACFALTVPPREDVPDVGAESARRLLERGARHYTLGMRGFYLAIPLTLWLLGPVWFLVGSIVLLLVLRPIDRA